MSTRKYVVIEDNGGLHLYVFNQKKECVYSHSGYEYNPGQLQNDLNELDAGNDTEDWEGCDSNPQKQWDYWRNVDCFNYNIVCDCTYDGKRNLHPNQMGTAARIEFGITVS